MAGHNPGSPTDFQYFYEDEVYKINNRGQVVFGLVLENFEGNSTDQESDVEDPVQKGEIRVVWHPSGIERVIPEESVGLADRSLMPGDVVRRLIAGKDTQRGYCRDIVMTAATQIVGTKHVIPNVASERLEPLEEFTSDLAVCLDSWVGTSKGVHSRLRLVSSDGSILEYPDLENCPLEDYSMRRRREARYASPEFYPGQAVFGTLGPAESSKWVHITKEMKNFIKQKNHEHKFTVEAVVTESVSVQWQCRALSTQANEAAPQQPKYLVEGEDLKNLKLLNVFEPCTLQVGDRNYLQITADDTFVTKKQWRKTQSKNYRNLRKLSRPPKKTDSKSSTFTERVSNSRPKKRCSSFRKSHCKDASISTDMELETTPEKIESLDDTLKDSTCPSIKIEPSGEPTLRMAISQEDSHTEEKNDSGISPEPNKEDSSFLNGDSKSSGTMAPDDDSENWENTSSDGSDTDSGATWSSRCSSVASRGKRSPQLVVRLFRGKRLKRTARRVPPAPAPRPGDKVVVETLHTTSHATVIWQDGTIETGIPSYQLYPIHHLDNQECFPGDFVVSGAATAEENPQMKHREYGVVQRVDHHGRTGIVNWYRTYTSADDPIPHLINVTEMSVYDLKDHPDFQYRPGTVVIRVANFTGEDANCTAGQVIDNFPSGRVKVWWVDGHTSMCWPQDLYKVGEYDSDEGELWGSDGEASEDSWETQSSVEPPPQPPPEEEKDIVQETALSIVPRLLEPRVAAHIERGRAAMRRLEELFHKHPTLQTQEIMRKLLNVYKDCRFLDKLMGTSFFHEDHFLGLLERVRERGASTPSAGERRLHDQLTRLFTPTDEEKSLDFPKPLEQDKMDVDEAVEENTFKDALGCKIITSNVEHDELMEVEESSVNREPHVCTDTKAGSSEAVPDINDAFENAVTEHDNRNVCQKLCSLIHSQLVKAHAEVSRRRPAELAEFLNKLMKNQNGTEENFPYHFSVQYGSLVVSMDALEDIEKTDEDEQKQNREDQNKPEGAMPSGEVKVMPTYETKSTSTSADIAPLAKAELADEIAEIPTAAEGGEGFCLLEEAPSAHRFKMSNLQPSDPKSFYSAIRREIKLLKSDLPPGVWVRGYENRMDLLSLMIAGPKKTPYEDGLFVFDVQLGPEYPRAPPLCHYHSYCCDRLNPNLYEDGKVCVSLLGTWSGRGVEVWGKDSSLLQVIVSLQGLILNAEPYFNEAGYEKQKGTQQGRENSRMYNEMVLLKLVQSLTRMLSNPPEPFRDEILRHLRIHAASLCHRLECWVAMSSKDVTNKEVIAKDVTDSSNVTAKDVTGSSKVTAKDVTDSSNVTAKDVTESSNVTAKDVTNSCNGTSKDVTDSNNVTSKDVTDSNNVTSTDVTVSNNVTSNDITDSSTSNNIDKVSNSVFNNIVADLKNVTPSSIVDVTIASDVLNSIDIPLPDFPLVPASRGFCLTLRSSLQAFRTALCRDDIKVPDSILL